MLVGYRQWLLIIHLIHFRMLWSLQKQSCSSKAQAIYALGIYDILFCWVVLVSVLNTDFLGVLLLQLHPGKEGQTSTLCTLIPVPGLPLLTFQNSNAGMTLWLNDSCLKPVSIILMLKKLCCCCVETWQSHTTVSSNSHKAIQRFLWPHPKCGICLVL